MKDTFLEIIELIINTIKEVWETVKQFSFENLIVETFGEEAKILLLIDKIKEYFNK